MRTKRGQAMIELAIGLVTTAIVVSALCGFGIFMARSLEAQNATRAGATKGNGKVEVGIYLAPSVIEKMTVKEHCQMPQLTIVR